MRFREVSSVVKEVQRSLERTSITYSNSTTAGNGVGDLMRKWAYILEQCVKTLDNKEEKQDDQPTQVHTQCKIWSENPLVECKHGFGGMCSDNPCTLALRIT